MSDLEIGVTFGAGVVTGVIFGWFGLLYLGAFAVFVQIEKRRRLRRGSRNRGG